MNMAILWDIENVTPPSGSNYVQNIIDKLSSDGKISYAMAFGDWSKQNKKLATDLAANSFELIHVPHLRNIKDSADMSMVAHGVELIFQYQHIDRYVLITGDADFRPLLQSLRKYGKETLIICNVINASEDLLKMADNFIDYRDLIDDDDDDSAGDDAEADVTKNQAFELLEEALRSLIEEKKTPHLGVLKIKMKLLNNRFNESALGFRSWKAFVKEAARLGYVKFSPEADDVLEPGDNARCSLPEVFDVLLKTVPAADSGKWMPFNEAAKRVPFRKYGYRQFKKLAVDAEKRGLVELRNEGFSWSVHAK
ncbi:MAG: NYN domain-containing protein [Bacteroides sp.]|nr:NYN domain-containing protein [Prevotella sp.]MCM1407129.1 NYN domain-containing protein [Treponema brennaborense]MCM1470281.1 NYN domain-containing protein [Bacteroides sp.]